MDIASIINSLLLPFTPAAPATAAALELLKTRARAWAKDVVTLYNMPVPASLAGEKKALLDRANTIRKAVEAIFGKIDELKNVQLGLALPVVGAVAVTGLIAAMTYWATDFGKFLLEVKRQAEANKFVSDLVAAGVPIDQAKAAASKDESKSLFERLIGDPQKIILPAVGLSIAGYLVYKYFINKR
jgi:hypothetical protein